MVKATIDGLQTVLRYWKLLLLLQLTTLLLAAFPAVIVGQRIAGSVESSLAAENLRKGFDDLWYRYFKQEATGLSSTFDPARTGAGALLEPIDDGLSGKLFAQGAGIATLGLTYFLCWIFLAGGILHTFWAREELSWPQFFAASAQFFGRLAVLGILGLAGYWLLLVGLHGWVQDWIEEATRNVIDERRMVLITAIKYGALWLLVGVWMAWLDGARVLVVAEDAGWRDSLRKSFRFLGPFALRVGVFYAFLLLCLAVYVAVYIMLAPGAGQTSYLGLIWMFCFSQILFSLRLLLRLLRPAALMSLYRVSGEISANRS